MADPEDGNMITSVGILAVDNTGQCIGVTVSASGGTNIVSAARSLTCRDDLDSKWRLLLAENELSCVSLLSSISIGN